MRPKSSPTAKPPARIFGRPRKAARPSRHTAGIRPLVFYGTFAGLLGTNVLALVALLMAPDIAALMNGQSEAVFAAYEDRIAELRVEVDRLHSRQYAQAGDINLQLQELTQQQEVLFEQHQYVRQLAEKAAELGIVTADIAADPADDPPVLVTSALHRPATGAATEGIEAAAIAVNAMMNDSRLALAALSQAAESSTEEILDELHGLGIRPALPAPEAIGGPLLPAADGTDAAGLVDDANAVFAALARFEAARGAIDAAPIHKPVANTRRVSSNFGNRRDPFTRRKAFHSGMDFPAPSGTTVLAAGDAAVVFVGKKSGYGNVVELAHGDGLVTRYAHLSAFLVKEGQRVETGTPIARVGSTGRSTGPHLHFEVRRDEAAVDPAPYLAAGRRLVRFFGA